MSTKCYTARSNRISDLPLSAMKRVEGRNAIDSNSIFSYTNRHLTPDKQSFKLHVVNGDEDPTVCDVDKDSAGEVGNGFSTGIDISNKVFLNDRDNIQSLVFNKFEQHEGSIDDKKRAI